MKKGIRVLVVDDDAAVRSSLTAFLEDDGFEARSASTAAEALLAFRTEAPDVAIVDVRLPEIDGPSLVLQSHAQHPGIRFILYTGTVGYLLPEPLSIIGMSQRDVLTKPARPMRVVSDAVRRLAKENHHV